MDEFAWQLASWLIAPVCAGVIGALGGSLKQARKREQEHDAERDEEHRMLMKGMRELLKSQLYDMHRRYVAVGEPMPYSEKQRATEVYAAYHGLGGNGTGTHIYQELMDAHVEKEE